MEKTNEVATQQAETWKLEAQLVPQMRTQCRTSQTKVESLERENQNIQRELVKLRESVEAKDVALDQFANERASQEKEKRRLAKDLEKSEVQIARLRELERESQELASRAAVDGETLAALQSDLVTQKLNTQQLRRSLEKMELDFDQLMDPDVDLERIASSPKVVRAVRELLVTEDLTELRGQYRLTQQVTGEGQSGNEEPDQDLETLRSENEYLNHQCDELRQELAVLQSSADSVHSSNAELQVTVATLES